jgi:hypothetical protein
VVLYVDGWQREGRRSSARRAVEATPQEAGGPLPRVGVRAEGGGSGRVRRENGRSSRGDPSAPKAVWSVAERESLLSREVESGLPVEIQLYRLNERLQDLPGGRVAHARWLKQEAPGAGRSPWFQDIAGVVSLRGRVPAAARRVSLRERRFVGARRHKGGVRLLKELRRRHSASTQGLRPQGSGSAGRPVGYEGYLLEVRGRIDGIERATRHQLREGARPRQRRVAARDRATGSAGTPYGQLGFARVICYGRGDGVGGPRREGEGKKRV